MKSTKFNPALILLLFIAAICFTGCGDLQDYIDDYTSKPCTDELMADTITNELIIYFDQKDTATFNAILDLYSGYNMTVHHCDCDENLALVQFPENIGAMEMEERRRQANDELTDEGRAEYNFRIQFEPVNGVYSGTFKPDQGGTNPADRVTVALIDGGINNEDNGINGYMWYNPLYLGPGTDIEPYGFDFTKRRDDYSQEINPHGTLVGRIMANDLPPFLETRIKLMDLRVFDKEGVGTLFARWGI